jgi:anti-sigma factor RsiW
MTCGELREILFAFLDNELDAALSIEVQRHLEHCPECASEVETERTIHRRLAAAMDRDAVKSPSLDALLRTVVTVPARGPVRRRTRAWIPLGIGIAAVVLLGVFAKNLFGPSDAVLHQSGLVDLLVADFDYFLSEGRPVQIASTDRREVSEWLHSTTGLSVNLPATRGSHCKLIGARKCKLSGQPAAFASYEMDASPACLVVLAGDTSVLDKMERVSHDGRTFWVDRCKDHSIVACVRDELIYAAVSRTDKDDLIHFMSELE